MKIKSMVQKIQKKYPDFNWFYKDTKSPSVYFGMNCNPVPNKYADRTIGMGALHIKTGWRLGAKISFAEYKGNLQQALLDVAKSIVERFELKIK